MQSRTDAARPERPFSLPLRVAFPLALGIIISVGILAFSEIGSRELEQVVHSHSTALEMQASLYELLGLVTDAETGQRGYMLTGKQEYLEPYRQAQARLPERYQRLRDLVVANGTDEQRAQVGRINALIGRKLGEIEATIALYDRSGRQAAFELMDTGIGRQAMEDLRAEVTSLAAKQLTQMNQSANRWRHDIDFARFSVQWLTACTIALLAIVWLLARREVRLQVERRRLLATESERLEREVRERTAELTELSSHLQTVREEEKSRLARDIHDELGGILVSAKMDISGVAQALKDRDPKLTARLERAAAALDDGVSVKRRIIEDLRPTLLDNLGLGPAIDWQVNEVCKRAGLRCSLDVPDDMTQMPPDVAIALYRIVQEALTNIVKYAGAKLVSVTLVRDEDGVELAISDDGVGLPRTATHDRLSHGIAGMRQRVRQFAGEFRISGEPHQGTHINVRIPLPKAEAGKSGEASLAH
ncbi:MAG: CHASE3 domain-containing protein [Proteobacteria bacterium]|nr:CHASE3 domain-containing protein [Pseudomonadota bacterium]